MIQQECDVSKLAAAPTTCIEDFAMSIHNYSRRLRVMTDQVISKNQNTIIFILYLGHVVKIMSLKVLILFQVQCSVYLSITIT